VLSISIYLTVLTFVFKNFWDFLWETKVLGESKIFFYMGVIITVLFIIWLGKKEKTLFFFGCILGIAACVIAVLWIIDFTEILSVLAWIMEGVGFVLTIFAPIGAAIYWFYKLPRQTPQNKN